jgi:hypothetical protein
MDKLFKLLDYFFFRWKSEFVKEEIITSKEEKLDNHISMVKRVEKRYYVYKLTNKFDGSVKMIREEI